MRTLTPALLLVIAATPAWAAETTPAAGLDAPKRLEWFSCPAERRIRLDLDAWIAGFGAKHRDARLAELGLRAVPDLRNVPAPACAPGEEPQLRSIESIPADLSPAEELDRVVRLRFETCAYPGRDERVPLLSERVQVLRPIAKDEWCALGDDLSFDRPAWDLPCAADVSLARELGFENVLHPVRQSLRVLERSGACDETGAYAEQRVTYWDASGRGLARIFSADTFEVDGMAARERVVRLEGEFPRRIVVTERGRCLADEGGLPAPDCVADAPATSVYSWSGGEYRSTR